VAPTTKSKPGSPLRLRTLRVCVTSATQIEHHLAVGANPTRRANRVHAGWLDHILAKARVASGGEPEDLEVLGSRHDLPQGPRLASQLLGAGRVAGVAGELQPGERQRVDGADLLRRRAPGHASSDSESTPWG
jgi:hypothetical protein